MRENKLRTIWANGGAAFNGWLHIPSMWSAELMAHAGWDSLTIDMQHGMADLETTVRMMQAISTTDTVPVVRVPWNEPGIIGRVLDGGAYGVICPMVNTKEQCEAFVAACRYAPQGHRSHGPTRVRVYAGDDYPKRANETVVTLAMIETKQALENVDEIASVPGLDGFYIGPADLRLSLMGEARGDNEEPEFIEVLQTILDAAKKNNIVCGIHTGSVSYARRMAEIGMQMMSLSSDGGLLSQIAKSSVKAFREGSSSGEAGSIY